MNNCSECERILQIINELIDGELEGERLAEAERLLVENPQCQTMFNSVKQTIQLYKLRKEEVDNLKIPEIDWDTLTKTVEDSE